MNLDKMSKEKENSDSWEACPPGELSQMVHRVDARQRGARRKQVLKTAMMSTAVFACVVLALGLFAGPAGSNYGNISCSYCRDHMAEYAPHLSGELVSGVSGELVSGELLHEDANFVANMKVHLEKCPFCGDRFEYLYPGLNVASTPTARLGFAWATPPELTLDFHPLFATSQTFGMVR